MVQYCMRKVSQNARCDQRMVKCGVAYHISDDTLFFCAKGRITPCRIASVL